MLPFIIFFLEITFFSEGREGNDEIVGGVCGIIFLPLYLVEEIHIMLLFLSPTYLLKKLENGQCQRRI